MRSMRSIVFSGGGIRCLSFAGVLSAIENIHGPGCWNQVREVSGASGGAIFAFIIAANISAKKVIDVLKTDDIKDSIREMRVGRSYLDHFRAIAEERSVCGFKPLQNMVTKIVQLKFSSEHNHARILSSDWQTLHVPSLQSHVGPGGIHGLLYECGCARG